MRESEVAVKEDEEDEEESIHLPVFNFWCLNQPYILHNTCTDYFYCDHHLDSIFFIFYKHTYKCGSWILEDFRWIIKKISFTFVWHTYFHTGILEPNSQKPKANPIFLFQFQWIKLVIFNDNNKKLFSKNSIIIESLNLLFPDTNLYA